MTIELHARPATAPRAVGALPAGFRFHPTDEELIVHYLRRRAASAPCPAAIIAEVDIYKLDPWELPSRAVFGQPDGHEWYFFSPRDRKYPNGVRPNRAAGSGYWKATGTDKPITAGSVPGGEVVGVKKALVFYQGRPPKGLKTNWIMHEYRLADAHAAAVNTYRPPSRFKASSSMRLDDWVLCRIYKKPNQQLSPLYDPSPSPPSMDAGGSLGHHHHYQQQEEEDSSSRMPPITRPPSISDYLVDYNAVSELFDTMPLPPEPESSATRFFLGSTGDEEASTARKRSAVDGNDNGGDMSSSLQASKRWLSSSDTPTTTMHGGFSMFGPDQNSSKDRI